MSKRAERIKTDFDLRKERTRESKLHGGGRPQYSTKVGFPLYRRLSHKYDSYCMSHNLGYDDRHYFENAFNINLF